MTNIKNEIAKLKIKLRRRKFNNHIISLYKYDIRKINFIF